MLKKKHSSPPAAETGLSVPVKIARLPPLVASINPDDFEPEFDLLAAASDEDLNQGATEPLNLYGLPRYLIVAVKRFQRYAHLEGVKVAKSKVVGAALDHGLQRLRGAPESQRFLAALEIAEAADGLSLSDELRLDQAIEGFKFTPRDPNSGYERWTVRVPEEVKSSFYATQSLLRIPVGSLAAACLGHGLADQPGVNPEASELMLETFADLRTSLRARAADIQDFVAHLQGKR